MKYWRGYLTAAVLAFFTWALMKFAEHHTQLIDRVYPYVTRLGQTILADWSSGAAFCLWQLLAVVLIVGILASIVVMIVTKGNLVQWNGWILALVCFLFFLHTGIYGLNNYAGPLAEDIRLNVTEFDLQELEDATVYYRDRANELSTQIPRNWENAPEYPEFEDMAARAGEGFQTLVFDRSYSVFAGSQVPVKKLGWEKMFTDSEIDGFTMPITGEAAINPMIPVVAQPFAMCKEMAHRMCIAIERDAEFAAFLACDANEAVEFQYSAYFMAYRYCYNALMEMGATEAVQRVSAGAGELLQKDFAEYRSFYIENRDEQRVQYAEYFNDLYIKASGDERGVEAYNPVHELLVSWYIQEIVLPSQVEEDIKFDPYDEDWVFAPIPTEPSETVPNE